MTTRFVGLKEFRQNMAKISSQAQIKNQKLIILKKNQPIFELHPLSKKESILENLIKDVDEALDDVKNKRLLTQKEVENMLGVV